MRVIRNMLFLLKPTNHVIMSHLKLVEICYPTVYTVVQ